MKQSTKIFLLLSIFLAISDIAFVRLNYLSSNSNPSIKGTSTYRIITKDGEERWIGSECNRIVSTQGEYLGLRGSSRDISEHVSLEKKSRESENLRAFGTMVGGVAHEFNNALQSLFLYAGLVKDQLPEEQAIRDDFEHLLDTANDAKQLVGQVMLISSLDSGHSEPLDLPILISDVLEQKVTAGLDVSRIEVAFVKNCPPVIGDKQQLRTVLINVIDNAILAIANGGELSVNLKCNEYASGKNIQSKRVRLTVTDTGVGMSEETLSQAFNPFFTTREVGQGKGFGLSIVYNILQNMGGSISATSAFGEGSSFIIEFPLGNIVEN